jgi:DNA-binding LytR/AlgR family response regulator
LKILICEDDPLQLEWLTCKLSKEHNFVSTAEQGDQGFVQWHNGRPWDFVITDYYFVRGSKVKNGLDLVREIHSVDPRERIIVQTSEWNLVVPPSVKLLRKPYPFHRLVRAMKSMQLSSDSVSRCGPYQDTKLQD